MTCHARHVARPVFAPFVSALHETTVATSDQRTTQEGKQRTGAQINGKMNVDVAIKIPRLSGILLLAENTLNLNTPVKYLTGSSQR